MIIINNYDKSLNYDDSSINYDNHDKSLNYDNLSIIMIINYYDDQ